VRSEIVVASVIALAGALAIGQAVVDGLADSPPPKAAGERKRTCDRYEPGPSRDREMTFAAVGDTVTAWRGPDRATSWVTYADRGSVTLRGGIARAGATTGELAAAVRPVEADVLVILTGTTDLRFSQPADQIELNLQRVVDRAGADQVLLSSIPPAPGLAERTAEFNDFLARVAYRHEWSFVDAGSAVRAKNCRYVKDLASDGVRPDEEGARLIGDAVRAALTTRASFSRPGGG
jgi:lysophospholipase L1-like esterase